MYGVVNLSGDARIEFARGQITTITRGPEYYYNGGLDLVGPHAFVADASDTSSNSALTGLKTIDADFALEKGASVVTNGAVSITADGWVGVDDGDGDGGSTLTIGGALDNGGTLLIGNTYLTSQSTVRAASVTNSISAEGGIVLSGSSTAEATLDVDSAAGFGAAGDLSGLVWLSGDALVVFARGQIMTIAASSGLTLIGPHAFVADAYDTGSNSALAGLAAVNGYFTLEHLASVTTSGNLSNSGTIGIDAYSDYGVSPGGSSLTIGGTLTNDGTIEIGPSSGALSARSMVKADSVVNNGAISLYGNGPTVSTKATLTVPGAFTNDGTVDLQDDYDKLAGPVGGTGSFNLSDDSRLQFSDSVANGETVTFGDRTAEQLILDQASSFNGAIDDFFGKGDMVIAKDFAEAATTLLYTQTGADSCSWTLTDGANTTVLHFAGEPYHKSDFSIVPAVHGAGLAIKFV